MEVRATRESSPPLLNLERHPGTARQGNVPGEKVMFQRIGWQRPSPDERRFWLIQGALILASVLAVGTLVFLALR